MSNVHLANASDSLLTPDEVATMIGVQRNTLAVWRTNGRFDLPYTKCGRLVRYRRSAVEAWLSARTGTSCAQLAEAAR